ncbi:hypothetical protein Daesc_003416 [Daldinia eschscholtzii]|uniref:Nephrocystin 3-like N-terminal domain-containing protein n=1 Tax=Daldinia eschscholtzii TaxID=292717 RepID=A0AAX6MUC3_9PEZI
MDPFAAIGLAGNIIAFVDFGFRLISTAKNIYNSKSGTNANNEDLYSMTEQLQQLTIELKVARPIGSSSQQDRRLYDVAIECENVSVELSKLLDKLKTKDPRSKRQALKAAARNWRKSDQKLELEKRLDRCKQQLSLELLSSMKTELLKRLSKLDGYSQTSENELRSLARNVESLRQGSNVYFLSVDALDQIRSLVQLSDEAISKVCQNRVLGALRFQSMGERFEDIGEVHTKTFDWIFDDKDIHTTRSEDFFVDSVSTDDGTRSSINGSGVADGADSIQESLESLESLEEGPSHNSSFACHISDASLTAESNESVISLLESQPEPWRSSSAMFNTKKIPESARQVIFKARDSFITWLESGSGVFHVSGKPGSGKSTLMKYLVQHPKTKDHLGIWANGKNLVVGRFFFWKPGSDLQKNVKGLIRGLLHCVLSQCPELIQLVFPEQWESSKQRENIHIEHHESRLAFERLIENQPYKQNKFVFFIDGLDEFEGHHADLARQIIKWTHGIQSVKFCISSREWPVFQDIFKDCLRIRLHELTRSDIRRFVGDRLCEMNFNLLMSKDGNMNDDNDESSSSIYEITRLKEDIVEGSDGVFLWVSLVLRHIENGIANGDRIQDLMKIVKSLPTELEPTTSPIGKAGD